MRILALIPARGGSKRVPGKNIRELGGKPLIVWSIAAAENNAEICDILVSTDDPAIAAVCKAAGALVPWLRPAELATDTASSVDVVLHALDWYESTKGVVDGILLLQPTSPFRSSETVRKGIRLFAQHNRQCVLGVSPAHTHPMWTFTIEEGCLVPFVQGTGLGMRSQDLPPVYEINGSLYLISPTELRAKRGFFGATPIPLVIDTPQEALDIDTEWDWALAQMTCAEISRQQAIFPE